MKNSKVALLGAGRMGQIHLANTLSLGIDVAYVYDPELSLTSLGKRSGVLSRITNDLDYILKDESVNACIIAAPSSHHVNLIEKCARARKAVFCEKPVSFDENSLLNIKQILKETNIPFQVGFNRRFDPGIVRIQRAIASNAIGKLNVIKITNRDPLRPRLDFVKNSGGLFFDFTIHDFDMVHFIANEKIAEIYAVADALIEPKLRDLSDVDTAIVSIKMPSGTMVVIDCSRETGYGYDQRIEIFGSKGVASLNNIRASHVVFENQHGALLDNIESGFIERYRFSYREQLRTFFENISTTRMLSPGIEEVLSAVRVCQAALVSAKENRSVAV
jgi:myo-inositol 2-dehydrogenase/D-chiro-inositol 1-dehydrogenase